MNGSKLDLTVREASLTTGLPVRESRDSSGCAFLAVLRFDTFDKRFCEKSWEWLNDPEIKKLTMTPDFTLEDQSRWFSQLPQMKDYKIWGVSLEDLPIGAVGLKRLALKDGEYWGYIGERRYWGLGLGRQMVRFVLDQARTLNLNEVFLRVHSDNRRALALYTACGFKTDREDKGILDMYISLTGSE